MRAPTWPMVAATAAAQLRGPRRAPASSTVVARAPLDCAEEVPCAEELLLELRVEEPQAANVHAASTEAARDAHVHATGLEQWSRADLTRQA